MTNNNNAETTAKLKKVSSGISGFDEITEGGLPAGRPAVVCGEAGAGKTMFGMQFLVHGATDQQEPGVFVAFEEREKELKENVASLGWDLEKLEQQGNFAIETFDISATDMTEAGQYDLEGVFVRLDAAIRSVGARRIVLDTVETLFSAFSDVHIVRAEFRRLLAWLKDRGITAIITAERGQEELTRFGVEEYVSDCVIDLSQTLQGQTTRRHLRIRKYRGTAHGSNAYPFLIGKHGFHLFAVTALGLDYPVPTDRVPTGVQRLDEMLGSKGFYRTSSILISGTAGTGKSSFAASFAQAACERGEQTLYVAHEESPSQIIRNMKSIGIDLQPYTESGNLHFHPARVASYGLEEHFFAFKELLDEHRPELVVIDPISNLLEIGTPEEVKNVLTRIIDLLKSRGITAVFTHFTTGADALEATEVAVSSLMDAWLLLRHVENGAERNRVLYIMKARGMAHSNQMRELIFSEEGIDLADVYEGPAGLVTGTARYTQEALEEAEYRRRREELERKRRELERKRRLKEVKLEELKTEFEAEEEELQRTIADAEKQEQDFRDRDQARRSFRENSSSDEDKS